MLDWVPVTLSLISSSLHIGAAVYHYWKTHKPNESPMFPLPQNTIGGYHFGEKTFYNTAHVGIDVRAKYVPLSAPFNGVIQEAFIGTEGGKTIWFKPDHDNVIIRFMHLSEWKMKKGDRVAEGQIIAITGNTGKYTTGPHLHLDISRPSVNLNAPFPGNFIDPEKYQWILPHVDAIDAPIVTQAAIPATTASYSTHEFTFPKKVYVTASRLNVRSKPSVKGAVTSTLSQGDDFTAVGFEYGEYYTVGNVTSDVWIKSWKGNFVAAYGTDTHL